MVLKYVLDLFPDGFRLSGSRLASEYPRPRFCFRFFFCVSCIPVTFHVFFVSCLHVHGKLWISKNESSWTKSRFETGFRCRFTSPFLDLAPRERGASGNRSKNQRNRRPTESHPEIGPKSKKIDPNPRGKTTSWTLRALSRKHDLRQLRKSSKIERKIAHQTKKT